MKNKIRSRIFFRKERNMLLDTIFNNKIKKGTASDHHLAKFDRSVAESNKKRVEN